MTLPAGYRLQQLTHDDRRAVLELDQWAFADARDLDELVDKPLPLSWDRVVGVVAEREDPTAVPADGAVPVSTQLVGVHASYPFAHFPVPGGEVPTSGLTWVGVHPAHRRRGLLTAMIDEHFARSLRRGEPVSALFAAEYAIYGRFGYGRASDDLRLTVPRRAALRDVPGADAHTVRIETSDRARHAELVEDLHRRAGADVGGTGLNRPGWVGRETPQLVESWWADDASRRAGREAERILVVERDGEPRGYTTFRRKLDWEDAGPRGRVSAGEVVALDAAAARALWGALVDLDLTHEVAPFTLPVDDVVTELLVDRRAATPRIADNLWIRLLDVPVALAARQYAADVDVVLEVTDARLPSNAGRWRVQAGAFGTAEVSATHAPADLALDVRDLAASYLGGVSLATPAVAGRVVEHRAGSLRRTAAAFSWPVAPGSSWVF